MQRSRKALRRRRRASENSVLSRKRLYKTSLSLVFILWGLFFVLNLCVGHVNNYRRLFSILPLGGEWSGVGVGESTWLEVEAVEPNKTSDLTDKFVFEAIRSNYYNQNACILSGETMDNSHESLVSKGKEIDSLPDAEKQPDMSKSDLRMEGGILHLDGKTENGAHKGDKISYMTPLGLEEFKRKSIIPKGKPVSTQASGSVHRVEPGGREYNYASASKGAKVLAFNKEAKGASNILDKDKDKYLRSPCSAEEKFVVIELSEETLVDTIEIANFEHYSSNLKDFELLSSLVYPTDNWVKLGNFTAENVKHAQRFALQEPKWARYLKLNLLSHYGSEFYCTLSVVEIYGVDAVERMLEDLISGQNNEFASEEITSEQISIPNQQEHTDGNDLYPELFPEIENESRQENLNGKQDVTKSSLVDSVKETRPQPVGRMPGDTVLKILMQKIRSLDLNFSVLERYLAELNSRYGNIFKDLDEEIAEKNLLLKKLRLEIKNLADSKDVLVKDVGELISWKALISLQLDKLKKDNALLRSEVEKIEQNQFDMENKGLAVIFVSFVFGCLAAVKLFVDTLVSVCRTKRCENFGKTSTVAWPLMLLSSTVVIFILLI